MWDFHVADWGEFLLAAMEVLCPQQAVLEIVGFELLLPQIWKTTGKPASCTMAQIGSSAM